MTSYRQVMLSIDHAVWQLAAGTHSLSVLRTVVRRLYLFTCNDHVLIIVNN